MNQINQFDRGDRVEYIPGYYGMGTVRYLNGDRMPDGSGRHYDWPDQVCVEFDREIDGMKPLMWCKYEELHKVSK